MSQLDQRALMTFVVIAVCLLGASLGVRAAFPAFWRTVGRRLLVFLLVAAAALAWGWRGRATFGTPAGTAWLYLTGMTALLTSSVALLLSAPVWTALGVWTKRLLARPARAAPSTVDPGRRRFLRGASGALPAMAVAVGPVGAVSATLKPVLREIDVKSRQVPAGLDGFTLLHITDVHLGAFIEPEQLQAVVDAVQARGVVPDCVVLTGDICDSYPKLAPALRILHTLAPKAGIFASIGNHEIYRGRDEAARIYAEEGVRLLCDDGVALSHGRERLWLCGADDPARGLDGPAAFLARTVEASVAGCPPDITCKVLLSHRPRGFVAAAAHGVTLTLSGHTHGAQMALFGRSLLEPLWPESFLLGLYRRGDSALYTSAGLGHWFPFRLNCPCEVALVTLRAGSAGLST
jgi:uncharacterized protein